ncbi:hypothetical protein HZA56_15555 [Candidatus Poribacteria bacterium]|nr:hypothetical protein [Candidatus Poribacteria bacterium]
MQEQGKIDIDKYLDILHKYKWHGIVPALIFVVSFTIGSLFLPKVYESSCTVEVDRGTIENPLKNGTERPPDLGDHLRVFSESALKWDILSRVVDKVGAEAIIENSDVYNIGKAARSVGLGKRNSRGSRDDLSQKEAVTALLRKGIRVQQRQPRFLVLSYRGTHSSVNADILNTLVSSLIEEKIKLELTQAGRSFEFLKTEMESYRQKLEEAEARLKEFKEQHISELPNDANINLSQLSNDKSDVLACELEMKELTTRVRYIDEELQKQKELVVSEVRREANPMLTVLNERIVDMEVELTRLRTNYTELHPRVVELKGQLEDLKRQRTEAENSTVNSETSMLNPVHQQLTQDKQNTLVRIEVLKNRLANLKRRVDENEKKVRSMPAQEQQLVTLTRNYEVTSNIYNMFLQKVEEVRVQEKLVTDEKDKESFRVIEYARATFASVAPNRMQLLFMILLAGGGICVGMMALLNFFDDSLRSVEEAKEFLKKPLLGTVPSLSSHEGNGAVSVRERLLKAIGKS